MRPIVAALDRASAWVALIAAWTSVAIMTGIATLILIEITLRSFFATSTQILEEFVGYGLGAMVFLGLAHALRVGGLVRVDILLGRLGRVARRLVEIMVCVVTLATMGFVIRYFAISVSRDFERGTISMTTAGTPIWIPNGVILLGMTIFVLTLAIYLLRLATGGPLVTESGPRE